MAMRVAIAILFLNAMMIGALAWAQEPSSAPLLRAGQEYIVVWDCTAQLGCFGEHVHVQGVRRDGWAVVKSKTDGEEWTLNPSRALAIQAVKPPLVASR